MERVAIIGSSLTEGNEQDLADLQARCDVAFQRELADILGASELVYLATCNRIEIIYAREEGEPPAPSDLDQVRQALGDQTSLNLRFCGGYDAVHHIFRVACSLDSLVLGEDQILFQMRAAHNHALENGLLGSQLTQVFRAAFQVGKQVRAETDLCRQPVSVMSLGVQALEAALTDRGWAHGSKPRIALLGAGRAAKHVVQALSVTTLSIAVCANRTAERARALGRRIGAQTTELENLITGAEPVDALICATGAPGVLMDTATLEEMGRKAPGELGLVGLDLALPRNLASDGLSKRVQILGMESLRKKAEANRKLRSLAASQAEQLITERLIRLRARATHKGSSARIESFLSSSREILEGELKRLADTEMDGLTQEERRKVERWARSTFGRLHHVSAVACRELGRLHTDAEPTPESLGDNR